MESIYEYKELSFLGNRKVYYVFGEANTWGQSQSGSSSVLMVSLVSIFKDSDGGIQTNSERYLHLFRRNFFPASSRKGIDINDIWFRKILLPLTPLYTDGNLVRGTVRWKFHLFQNKQCVNSPLSRFELLRFFSLGPSGSPKNHVYLPPLETLHDLKLAIKKRNERNSIWRSWSSNAKFQTSRWTSIVTKTLLYRTCYVKQVTFKIICTMYIPEWIVNLYCLNLF